MDEQMEDRVYAAQEAWIRARCGKKAAEIANYGWYVDEYTVSTKIYGHGILMSCGVDDHTFEPFNNEMEE